MSEETKEFIKQFKKDTQTILDYQDENKVEVYKHIKTGEIVVKEYAIDYIIEKLGLEIHKLDNNMDEQYEFIKSTIEWFFSGNWYELKVRESEL